MGLERVRQSGHSANLFHDSVSSGIGGLEVLIDGLNSFLESSDIHITDQLDAVFINSLVQNFVFKVLPCSLVLFGGSLGALGHSRLLIVGELVPDVGRDDDHIGDTGVLIEAVVLGHIAVVTQSGDIVLSTVDNALLHTGVDIAVAHKG